MYSVVGDGGGEGGVVVYTLDRAVGNHQTTNT